MKIKLYALHTLLLVSTFTLSACSETSEQTQNPPVVSTTEISPEIHEESVDTPEIPEEPEKIYQNHKEEGGKFELPLYGASGFTGISMALKDSVGGNTILTLEAGSGFYILQEEGDYWEISLENGTGWVESTHCFINLPDILPSIVYENPYANICYSCSLGKDIPHVTGEQLYEAKFYNQRLDEEVYLTPVLYETAKKLGKMQESALKDGNSLLIFECYRPYTVQKQLVNGLDQLMSTDSEVNTALTSAPWSKVWFVSGGISNHQRGRSIDMTLVKVDEITEKNTGDYKYQKITGYTEHIMPTQFDELSPLAAVYAYPVSPSGDGWKTATYSETMTESAILLQNYATAQGLVPLASEWWHFDDPTSDGNEITGNFMLTQCYSVEPFLLIE